MSRLDINMLKENPDEFANCRDAQKQLEKAGNFNEDENENSYEGCMPVDESFDYMKRGFRNSMKRWAYTRLVKKLSRKINRQLTNLKVVGRQNLRGVKGAAIVTCNHISKVDSFAVRRAMGMKIKFVAADYHNWQGIMGEMLRYTGYIPLPMDMNLKVMRKFNEAIDYFLSKKKRILIYPEQAMWREYKKPRPLKNGAFHYAVKNNCPIIPLFITIKDKEEPVDAKGRMNFGDYTIHILPPIYPRDDLDKQANIEYMKNKNFELWKQVYEETYQMPLVYDTDSETAES